MNFDDFLQKVNDTWGEKPRDPDAPVEWEFTSVNTDTKGQAKVMEKMSKRGWEYVTSEKNPLFSLRAPLALTFRRPK